MISVSGDGASTVSDGPPQQQYYPSTHPEPAAGASAAEQGHRRAEAPGMSPQSIALRSTPLPSPDSLVSSPSLRYSRRRRSSSSSSNNNKHYQSPF